MTTLCNFLACLAGVAELATYFPIDGITMTVVVVAVGVALAAVSYICFKVYVLHSHYVEVKIVSSARSVSSHTVSTKGSQRTALERVKLVSVMPSPNAGQSAE